MHSFTAHFVERWNFVKKNKYGDDARYGLLPPYPTNLLGGEPTGLLSQHFTDALNLNQPNASATTATGGAFTQLCRSATKWSQGIETEKSVQNAYIDLITNSTRKVLIDFAN